MKKKTTIDKESAEPARKASAKKTAKDNGASTEKEVNNKRKASASSQNTCSAVPDQQLPYYQEDFNEHIRVRAYYIAEERVRLGVQGSPLEDWCQAESEINMEESGKYFVCP